MPANSCGIGTDMSTRSSSTGSGGIGVLGLLGVLFVGLKLAGYIDWSWWWVMSPLWIPALVAAALLLGVVIYERRKGI